MTGEKEVSDEKEEGKTMNSPEVTAAKMICKSVDALTREIYLLRKDVLDGQKLNAEMRELGKGADQIPPSP